MYEYRGLVPDEAAITDVKVKINNFIESLTPDIQSKLDNAFSLKSSFDVGDISVKELKDGIGTILRELESVGFDDETISDIRSSLGVDIVDKQIDAIKEALGVFADKYGILGKMSGSDLAIANELLSVPENSIQSWDELVAAIQNYKRGKRIEAAVSDFKTLKEAASGFVSEMDAVQNVLNSQSAGQSISIEDYNSEELKDYQSALEYTNGAMQLNADKVREISEAKADEQIAINNTNKALAQGKYLENAKEIERYRQKLKIAKFENGETAETIQNSIDALLEENSAIAATCSQYDLLSSSIREAVGAYQHWLNAQSASDYGDMADDAVSAIEHIRDTYNSSSDIFGNFGSKKFDAAVDFIIPETVDSDDLSAIESYMNNFQQYLTFDDNGNATGLNIDQFLSNAVEAGLMNYSEENGWTIAGQKSMENFAEGLDLSSGIVQAFFDELQLKGAEFDWSDESVQSFGDLAVKANEAAEALRKIKGNENLNIQLDVSNFPSTEDTEEQLKKQLSALDSTISEMNDLKAAPGIDTTEIENANTIIQYCIMQKQLLTQPDVMRVDTSQTESDISDVITLIQDFQNANNNLEIQQNIGADTTEAQAEVDALLLEIQDLAPNIKTDLNLDPTSVDALKTSNEEYKDVNSKGYNGIDLVNATGYQKPTQNWDNSDISGTNPSNQPPPNSETPTFPNTPKPSLERGSSIKVKDTATHFGSYSNNLRMASFVPGGTYTVYETSGNQVLIGRNGVYTGWVNKSDIVGYATGTRNATAGLHSIDELGTETTFESKDGTRYKLFTGGEKVLNANASNFLYEFANGGGEILSKIIRSALGGGLFDKISPNIMQNEITMGNIIVQGNCDRQTVSEIRRAQREGLSDMLKSLNKLNK